MEAITDFSELILKIDEGLAIRKNDIAEGSRFFSDFYYKPDSDFLELCASCETHSDQYLKIQMDFFRKLAGSEHNQNNEGHDTLDPLLENPDPYHMAPADIGYWTIIYGHLLQLLNLPSGARVLEVGFGPGGLTEVLVRAGLDVWAVEVRQSNCDFVKKRVGVFGKTVTTLCGDIASIRIDEEFDAIIFFESFHHLTKPFNTISKLRLNLKEDGKIFFGAEPIVEDNDPLVPYPWGLRMDGGSLGAARGVGWVEFGFKRSYFLHMMQMLGFSTEVKFLTGYHHSGTWICQPDMKLMLKSLKGELKAAR